MSRSMKSLLACQFLALLVLGGCSVGTQEKKHPTPSGDVPADLAKKQLDDDPDEPEPSKAPVFKPPTERGGRRIITVETPQGMLVELPADHDPWADRVVSFKMGKPAARSCTDPKTTVGKPDYAPKRQAQTCLSMGHKGELVLEFVDNRLFDGTGDDLVVFEVGPVVEPMHLAISVDGKDWISVGTVKGAKCTVDIGPYLPAHQRYREPPPRDQQFFRFVKITDAGAGLSNKSQKPGADLDAVGALNSVPAP